MLYRQLGRLGIDIAHAYATLGTIGFEGRFDYAAIGTVSNVASRLCDGSQARQILISPRVLMAVKDAVTSRRLGSLKLKGIRRPVAAHAQHTAERRHVTVMFCDLVDSTGIAARLDAEEWRDLVGAYLDAVSAAVTEMGGKVAKKLGDGLMALFGYPVRSRYRSHWGAT